MKFLNRASQNKLMVKENTAYKQALDIIAEIQNVRRNITKEVWTIAVLLNKVNKEMIWQKAGFLSFFHFLSAAGLKPYDSILAIAADVFTEEEFLFLDANRAKLCAKAVRDNPNKKDEIFALAQSAGSPQLFRKELIKMLPGSHHPSISISFRGDPDQIDTIKSMIDTLLQTGEVGQSPTDVIEFALADLFTEIKEASSDPEILEAIRLRVDEATGVNSKDTILDAEIIENDSKN